PSDAISWKKFLFSPINSESSIRPLQKKKSRFVVELNCPGVFPRPYFLSLRLLKSVPSMSLESERCIKQ
ncbi:hypothetical protein MHBO_005271, partial [Bonamia ostreae]